MEPVLEVRNLNTYYTEGRLLFGQKGRRHQVLKDVSFTIGQGEIVGLVGESGSGKTTLARTILGFVNDYEGQIIHHSDRPQMVFQDPFGSLNPSFTIGKILEEPLIIKGGYTAGQRKDEVYEMLRQVGLDESYAERMPNELSGGQRQAMALLMSTLTPLEFLILDEHTAALDPKTAEIIMELTDKIVKEKKLTAVMVTHNLRYAVDYGDRIIMMHKGQVVLDKENGEKERTQVKDLLTIFNEISIECGN